MTSLQKQQCILCPPDSLALSEGEIDKLMLELKGWQMEIHGGIAQLVKQFGFPDYVQSMAFTQRVGALAEAEDHHPSIVMEWGKVRGTWWTHSINGLHINDFICAAKTDELVA